MNGPRYYHAEWSKPDRKRQISYDITYVWYLKGKKKKIQVNLSTKLKWNYRCGKQTWLPGYLEGLDIDWKIGIDIYTLLYTK